MILERFTSSGMEENAYVFAPGPGPEAVVVDPGEPGLGIDDFLRRTNLELKGIFITHGHFDHVGGIDSLKREWGAEVVGHPLEYPAADVPRDSDGEWTLGETRLRILHVPGHTEGHLVLSGPGILFTGDALFAGSIGGTADRAAYVRLCEGIRVKLLSLPSSTRVFPGHGPATTIGIECAHNPFLSFPGV